jgi:CRISPR-associated protein Csc3
VSNVPVFPLVVKESHHGHKFLSALEKAAVLTRWFDCRLLLSRLPTPVLNLAEEYRDGQPVVLLIENVPQALRWLVPDNTLLRDHVKELCRKLGVMHTIAQLLAADDEQLLHVVYDLVSAAALDPLAIYHETDRLIEKKVTQKKSKQPAQLAIQLSHQVAPLLKQLNEGV